MHPYYRVLAWRAKRRQRIALTKLNLGPSLTPDLSLSSWSKSGLETFGGSGFFLLGQLILGSTSISVL